MGVNIKEKIIRSISFDHQNSCIERGGGAKETSNNTSYQTVSCITITLCHTENTAGTSEQFLDVFSSKILIPWPPSSLYPQSACRWVLKWPKIPFSVFIGPFSTLLEVGGGGGWKHFWTSFLFVLFIWPIQRPFWEGERIFIIILWSNLHSA